MRLKHYFLILGWRRTCTRAWPLNELLAADRDHYANLAVAGLRAAGRVAARGRDSRTSLKDFLGPNFGDEVADWIRAGANQAIIHWSLAECVSVIRAVLEADDRAERLASLLSDAVLARAQNKTILPVSAHRLKKAMLRDLVADVHGAELRIQKRLLYGIEDAIGIL
ncbi:DUF1403 family protein [uncultured Tateyamaria sp.]|uniref:DUF1403 family protein n=1 Tax=uncultured Tateyamaria sp. TaxID=455651 RepID=UPI00262AB3C9|nr:DUF1403 family protein [uncultured Tateyamaria sp.]